MDMKLFNQIEAKYDLLNTEIDGYYFWNYSRWRLADFYELRKSGGYTSGASAKETKTSILTVLKNIKIPVKSCDMLVINHPRRVMIDGIYECIYTDKIVEQIGNAVVLEEPYEGSHSKPVHTPNLFYTDIIGLQCYLHCVMTQVFRPKEFERVKNEITARINNPIKELNEVYHVEIKPDIIVNEMMYGYFMYQKEYLFYKKIIKRLRPKVILEVVSYNRECMVVNEIAKEMNIPTIELQHGIIGEEHSAYNFPQGYDIKQFPQYIFLFSEYWKNKASFPIAEAERIATGYPHLERMANRFISYRENRAKQKTILFLSSGPIGDKLSQIAVDLKKSLDADKFRIIYKLHPKEYVTWQQDYPHLIEAGVEVIDTNQINLYELFAISDVQVSGYNSTTVFEGLYFNLQTFILNYATAVEIDDLCKKGVACYFDDATELAALLNSDMSIDLPKNNFWQSNALENTVNEIYKIMND
ncbi:MAG: hypothetical protein IJO65_01455 [Lachnospiraceae bacterium]|nr:hypothetical protein [Lachnospiraceae bacterium]